MIRAVAVTAAYAHLAADVAMMMMMMIYVWMWKLVCYESVSSGCVIAYWCPRARASVGVDADRCHRADPMEALVEVVVET